jgi:hypothetical protein
MWTYVFYDGEVLVEEYQNEGVHGGCPVFKTRAEALENAIFALDDELKKHRRARRHLVRRLKVERS